MSDELEMLRDYKKGQQVYCPKCGNNDLGIVWMEATVAQGGMEYMRRGCNRCAFWWREKIVEEAL